MPRQCCLPGECGWHRALPWQTYRPGSIIPCCCSGYNRVLWPSPSPCPSLRISKQSPQTHQPGDSFPSWPGPTRPPLSEQNFTSSAGPRLILRVFRSIQSSDPPTLGVCLKLPQLLLQLGDKDVLTHALRTEMTSVSLYNSPVSPRAGGYCGFTCLYW